MSSEILIIANAATILMVWIASVKVAVVFGSLKTNVDRNTRDIKDINKRIDNLEDC